MKPIETAKLADVLKRYSEPVYRINLSGLNETLPVLEFLALARALHAEGMAVDVYDAEFGLQLFDPKRSSPLGWIQPNPLRTAK